MAFVPTDNSPQVIPVVHGGRADNHDDHHNQPGHNVDAAMVPQAGSVNREEAPDLRDGFASVVVETLRDLPNQQVLYAQTEILGVLSRARFVEDRNNTQDNEAGASGQASNTNERRDDNLPEGNRAADDDSADLEWGFLTEDTAGPVYAWVPITIQQQLVIYKEKDAFDIYFQNVN